MQSNIVATTPDSADFNSASGRQAISLRHFISLIDRPEDAAICNISSALLKGNGTRSRRSVMASPTWFNSCSVSTKPPPMD